MNTGSIKVNFVLNIIYTAANIMFPLITFPYVSRILQVEFLGKVNFFSNISSYAITMAALGITTYGIRAVARVRENKDDLTRTVYELFTINCVSTVLVAAVLLLSAVWIPKFRDDIILLLINIALVLCAPLSVNWLFSGLEQYSYITKRTLVVKTVSLICVFCFVRERKDYYIYALILVLSSIAAYVCNYLYSKRFLTRKKYRLNCRKHMKPMLVIFASILAINVYTHLDVIMLGFINGDNEVGLYTTAVYVKTALLSLVNAISAVLLPRISYYAGAGKTREINHVLSKSVSIIMMLTIPLTVFFILTAKDTIMIMGGMEYINAVPCMRIIMPILLISGFSNITGNQILIPFGLERCFMKAVVAGALANLVLNLLLMPSFGGVGAAVATLVAELIQMLIQLKYAWAHIKHSINFKTIIKSLGASICATILFAAISGILAYTSILRITILAALFFLSYGIALLMMKEKEFCSITHIIKVKLLSKLYK